MQRNSVSYIVMFAAAVCVVCSLLVSTAATVLKNRQIANGLLDKQKKILSVSGLIEDGAEISREAAQELFDTRITSVIVNLETGDEDASGLDPVTYDQQKALGDPELSKAAPANAAQVKRLPKYATIYEVKNDAGDVELYVFPVEGKGLWSTLYGFLAVESDLNTVAGLTFYKHGETPGLGGEVDNPSWKARWPGRKVFGESGEAAIEVIKGAAGDPEEAPHQVDGLSGSTLTSRGVTHLLRFWMSEQGFGPFIEKHRQHAEGSAA